MNENTPATDPAVRPVAPGVLARHIAERCAQLGLTEAELAKLAAMSPGYLRHLAEAGPELDPNGFLRVAAALRLTRRELLEGRSDAPPGQPGAAARPALFRLTEPECWEMLGDHGIGRIALAAEPGPVVFPVNYLIDARTVVYRTDPNGGAAVAADTSVSVQVDHIDDRLRQGWSVLVVGTTRHVDDLEAVERLARLPGSRPWAGGHRPLWVRIQPERVTGRRIGSI
ncbi:pyridoxamine 5'-phosphate oxidase family protein [Kitasatospora sp. NPDC001175]|uniref:pyridoxamine 5'-phosphate oxidase family protein n=1 Tax=Kitasatospora sp. NPDC001175 TaxID=3157103 RepID=UPI003D03D8BA